MFSEASKRQESVSGAAFWSIAFLILSYTKWQLLATKIKSLQFCGSCFSLLLLVEKTFCCELVSTEKSKKTKHSVIIVKDFQCDLWLIIWLVVCAFLGRRSQWLMTQNLETYFHVIALVLKTKMSSVLVNCFT